MNNKDIFQCIFEHIEEKTDFINLALSCKNAYKASKSVHIYYRVFESNTTCCACDMSRYIFFNELEEAYQHIKYMKEKEKKIFEQTGNEYGFMYQIDKCFAPPWIRKDHNVKVLELIERIEPEFYDSDSDLDSSDSVFLSE